MISNHLEVWKSLCSWKINYYCEPQQRLQLCPHHKKPPNTSTVYLRDPNLFITVSADGLAPQVPSHQQGADCNLFHNASNISSVNYDFQYGFAYWETLIQTLTLSQWSSSGNPVAIQCAWNLDPSVHWNATGEMPVCFQWSSSGLPVAFQWSSSVFHLCKLTLDSHWDTTGC